MHEIYREGAICSIGIPWHSMAFLLVAVGFIVFCLELQHWPWSRSPNVQRYIDSMDRLGFFVFFSDRHPSPKKESHPVRWGYQDPQFFGVNIKKWLKLNHQDHHKLWRQSNVLVVFLHPMQFAYVERNMPCQGWCRCHSGGHFRPGMDAPGGGFTLRDAVLSLSCTSIDANFGFTEHKIMLLDLIGGHSWSNASTTDLRSYLNPNGPHFHYLIHALKFINKKQGQQTVGSIVRDFDDKKTHRKNRLVLKSRHTTAPFSRFIVSEAITVGPANRHFTKPATCPPLEKDAQRIFWEVMLVLKLLAIEGHALTLGFRFCWRANQPVVALVEWNVELCLSLARF